MIDGYYYLHENGSLIYKQNFGGVVADLRDSDLVVAFWGFDLGSRQSTWSFLVEALSIGAKKERVNELASKWKCNDEDGKMYASRIGVVIEKDGDSWCVRKKDFTDLQKNPAGFGDTILEALAELCKNLEFKSTKLQWHATFEDLLKVAK